MEGGGRFAAYEKKPGQCARGWPRDPGNFDWFGWCLELGCRSEPGKPHRFVKNLQRTDRLTSTAFFPEGGCDQGRLVSGLAATYRKNRNALLHFLPFTDRNLLFVLPRCGVGRMAARRTGAETAGGAFAPSGKSEVRGTSEVAEEFLDANKGPANRREIERGQNRENRHHAQQFSECHGCAALARVSVSEQPKTVHNRFDRGAG